MHVASAMRRLQSLLDGNGPVVASTVFFVVLGLILIPVVFSSVQWSGTAVKGVDRGGIVYYSYAGQNYSLDDTSRFYSHTVYLNPKNPDTSAELGDTPSKVLDVASVTAPFLIALAIIGAGVRRQRRFARGSLRDGRTVGDFGHGLEPEVIHRLLDQRHQGDRSI